MWHKHECHPKTEVRALQNSVPKVRKYIVDGCETQE